MFTFNNRLVITNNVIIICATDGVTSHCHKRFASATAHTVQNTACGIMLIVDRNT